MISAAERGRAVRAGRREGSGERERRAQQGEDPQRTSDARPSLLSSRRAADLRSAIVSVGMCVERVYRIAKSKGAADPGRPR